MLSLCRLPFFTLRTSQQIQVFIQKKSKVNFEFSSVFFSHSPSSTDSKNIRKCLFTGTVPVNKNYRTGTVPVNKNYRTGTVPVNKNYRTGTVPVNKNYRTGTVPVNKNYPTGTLINKLTIFSSKNAL